MAEGPVGCILKAGIEKEDIYQFVSPKYKQKDGRVLMPISVRASEKNKRPKSIGEIARNLVEHPISKTNFFVVSKGKDDIDECFSGKLVNIFFQDYSNFEEKLKNIPAIYKNEKYNWNVIFEIENYECVGHPLEGVIEEQLEGYLNTKREAFDFNSFFEQGRGLQYLY